MATHDYHFISHWRVRGSIEEIAEILAEPLLLPRWWPSVYLGVRELAKGHPETSVGREIELFTKGWLPYTLTWRFRVTANRRPHGSSIAASGDLEGTGEWTLSRRETLPASATTGVFGRTSPFCAGSPSS
jgi:hypothetical protein